MLIEKSIRRDGTKALVAAPPRIAGKRFYWGMAILLAVLGLFTRLSKANLVNSQPDTRDPRSSCRP
jgi:hypothetical protein